MNKIIAVSFFSVIGIFQLSSCSESPKEKRMEIKFDALIYDGNGEVFTGTKISNINGKIIEFEVVSGMKHGLFRTTYENGNPEMEGYIFENKNDGLWKYYYNDGNLESEGNFKTDKVEGKWLWYYPSGKLRETAEYKDGLKDGKVVFYDTTGSVIDEKLFEGGIEVK